jgi:hypothetical protein
MSSRKVPRLSLTHILLAAPIPAQSVLLQYRRGVFMLNSSCACDPEVKFHRCHETRSALTMPLELIWQQRRQKLKMQAELSLSRTTFIDIDYLLNSGQIQEASLVLMGIQRQLRSVYREHKLRETVTTLARESGDIAREGGRPLSPSSHGIYPFRTLRVRWRRSGS